MENRITVITELCQEDRARLDRLIAALEGHKPACDKCVDTVAAALTQQTPAEPPTAAAQPQEDTHPLNDPSPFPEPQEQPAEQAAPAVTLDMIQTKVRQLATGPDKTKKEKVREIVNDYAQKVSDLPEDKLPEVWSRLIALEG